MAFANFLLLIRLSLNLVFTFKNHIPGFSSQASMNRHVARNLDFSRGAVQTCLQTPLTSPSPKKDKINIKIQIIA